MQRAYDTLRDSQKRQVSSASAANLALLLALMACRCGTCSHELSSAATHMHVMLLPPT